MTAYNRVTGSGDGTRPTTDGTVDNMGAGEKFSTARDAAGNEINGGPAPEGGMANKRRDVEGTRHDDSAAYELREDLSPEPNKEPPASHADPHKSADQQ